MESESKNGSLEDDVLFEKWRFSDDFQVPSICFSRDGKNCGKKFVSEPPIVFGEISSP